MTQLAWALELETPALPAAWARYGSPRAYLAELERIRRRPMAEILEEIRAAREPIAAATIAAWRADGWEICRHCGRGIAAELGRGWVSVVLTENGGQLERAYCDATPAELHTPACEGK